MSAPMTSSWLKVAKQARVRNIVVDVNAKRSKGKAKTETLPFLTQVGRRLTALVSNNNPTLSWMLDITITLLTLAILRHSEQSVIIFIF